MSTGRRQPFFSLLLIVCLLTISSTGLPQDSSVSTLHIPDEIERLNKLVDALDKKIIARQDLRDSLVTGATPSEEAQKVLDEYNADIESMRETFELLTVGDFDDSLFKETEDKPFDWQVELMLVLEPLIDSLQSLTEKPRQMTALRDTITLNRKRLQVAGQAITNLERLQADQYEEDTRLQVEEFQKKWLDQKESFEQRLLAAQTQLERLDRVEASDNRGFMPSVKAFILGRGLTLLLATCAAVIAWFVMRTTWWLFSTHLINKEQRRGSLWFRLLSYSIYLVNILVCTTAVMAVLYWREDLLLLALALLLLVVAALGIRRYIPAYVREARLLLDLGSVREGERVMYNNLPWQVMSINLHTVLWNPALEGIVRLPLETIETLTSRPVKDKNWFPTKKDDFLLLPDNTFAQVLSQTPELVQLRIRGGMVQWIPTAGFYAMNIINLSAGKTFGISVTFGLDYEIQAIGLTDVPRLLKAAVNESLQDQGYTRFIDSLLVELKTASASSIDYLIFATIKSELASDFFRIERLIQQACVAAANDNGWNIPFPQMKIHYQPAH